MEKPMVIQRKLTPFIFIILALSGLYYSSIYSYLLFHSLAEIFCIAIALCVFLLAWNSRKFLENNYLLFLGVAYLFIGGFDLVHTLAYKGMGVFPTFDSNLPTQLWIVSRYLLCISTLIAPIFIKKTLKIELIIIIYLVISTVLFVSIFAQVFPVCYIEGMGLTSFKIISEYLISLIMLGAILALYYNQTQFDKKILNLLIGSILLTILSELCFTLYIGVYDLMNLIGHILKMVSYYLIYLAIIEKGVTKPLDLLFRSLKQNEEKLIEHQARLEEKVKERTAELTELNRQLEVEVEERKRIEATLRQRNTELDQINQIIKSFITTPDLDQSMITVLEKTRLLINATSCSAWFVQPKTGSLHYLKTSSALEEYDSDWWSTNGSEIGNWVIRHGKNLLITDLSKETETRNIVADTSGLGSIIAVPLIKNNNVDGVIAAISNHAGCFKNADLLLELLASAVVHSIERMQLLDNIRANAQQMQDILNTVPEGVFLLDTKLIVQNFNPLAKKFLEILTSFDLDKPITKLGDKPIKELLHSPIRGIWHQIQVQDQIFKVISQPIQEGMENTGWVVIVWDATEEYYIQNKIQQQDRLAAVGQVAAGIAHDFNNIMSVIVLYAQIALNNPAISASLKDNLSVIQDQAMNATNLIKQILDFSKSESLEKYPLNLLEFVNKQIELLERTFPENINIKLTHGYDNYNINGDSTRIQQVIMNLAINARDAMPDGGLLSFELELIRVNDPRHPRLPGLSTGDWVKLDISDTGIGMSFKVQQKIFEPFFTTKERGRGTGLGLTQVYGIIKNHGGDIQVDSLVGKGTTFTIYLPAITELKEKTLHPDDDSIPLGSGELILLVEDDDNTRKAIAKTLEALNYKVIETENGREALEKYDEFGDKISAVLTDLVMPDMGGKQLAQILMHLDPNIKLVVLTGHPITDDGESLKKAGISTWIQKPSSMAQLAQVVAGLISS